MQGYMWTSNQPARYQEQPSASYQEQHPPPYHQHFQPNYQAVRNDQPNTFQAQYNPQIPQNQHYATTQASFSNGQQEATNQWSSSSNSNNFFAPALQSNSHGYDQTRQPNPGQYQYTASNRQQQYSSEKPNTYVYYSQLNTQANASSTQNYRNTDCSQAPMNWTSQSNSGNSVGNNRAWTNHNSKNESSCSINNQQQLQPFRRTLAQHHQHQQFSKQQSVKWQKKHQSTQGNRLRYTIKGRKDQTATNQTSSNSVTPPSGAHNNVTLPVSNQNQSPVNQNQPELRVNPGPAVSQSQNYQGAGDQCQGMNSGAYNVMQTTQANGADCRFVGSIIYHLLCSGSNEKTNMQQSHDIIAHQNTVPQQFEGFANNRTDHNSKEPNSSQCTNEPPSKRIKHGVAQVDYWNKETSVSNDRSDSLPGTHLTDSHENRLKRTSQHTIQYSTDPADCLEAVLALKKAGHQGHKAIAIVPPITQQALNDAQTVDEILKKADSPPLKIDSVWSLDKESDAQKIASDSEPPSQTTQDDKSIENETESRTETPDTCCISPTECQSDVSDSTELSFDLSNVPVTEYTLENLTGLVKTLEMTELSAGYPEQSESVLDTILKLYWNGKEANIRDPLISFRKHAPEFYKGIEIDWDSVVLKSIETENLEKLAHCSILKNEMNSSSEEFKSSWLNVDGQPADIEKVLSEPMPEDSTETDNTGITSLNKGVNLPQILPSEKSVKPNTSNPSEIFTPLAGNGQEEVASENNGPYVDTSLSKKQMQSTTAQSHTLNAKSSFIAQLVKRLTEKPTMGSMDSLSPRDNVSEGAKTLCNSTDTWSISKAPNPSSDVLQVGDTSDCKNPGIKEALNNSSETWLVENISDDENSGKKEVPLKAADILIIEDDEHVEGMEVLLNTSDIWLVDDISDDVNSGNSDTLSNPSDICVVNNVSNEEKSEDKEVSPNASEIWQVEDISDDENSDNKDTHNDPSDICVVEDNKTEDKEVSPNTSDIWLVEDISDDEDSGNKDALNDPSDICVVEDVSNKEKSEDKEVSPNTSEIWQVEDISDDEDSGNKDTHSDSSDVCVVEDVSNDKKSEDKEVSPNTSEIWQVEDISEYMETLSDSSDIRVVDGTSNDENSSDEPFLMKMTVLSSEDAQTFFQPECTTETKSQSKLDRVACLDVPTEPNHEYNQTNICSLCSTTTTATMMNNDYCLRCWEQAPLLELEEESEAEAEVPGSPAKSNAQCENCSPPYLKVKEPKTCIAKEGLAEQKSVQRENCCPPLLELQVEKPTVALLGPCSELDQNLSPPFLEPEVLKSPVASAEQSPKLKQIHSLPSPELKVKNPTEECFADEVLTGLQRQSMVMSEQGPNRSSPSTELNAQESNCALPETRNEELTVQKGDFMEVLQLKRSKTDSTEQHKGLTLQKRDSMVKTATKTLPKKQKSANPELNKIRLKKIKFIFSKPQPKKTPASSNHKLKSATTTPDECVLFAPDIVVKKNCPGVPAKKCPSGASQNANKVKKFKEHRQERKYKNSQTHRENVQKVTEKVPNHSNESPVHTSKRKSNGILSVHKAKMIEPKKVRFDLYGSKTEELYYAKERRFSPPTSLTVSDSCDYTDVLSAKQKVHSLWSSTFIPPKKSSPSRSHQEGKPQKTKTMKPQDLLKSNMSALKSHLTHRAMLLSNGEMSHFRKPFSSRQKLTKTLSS